MGPLITEDSPLVPCPPFQILLRYMEEWKLRELLEKGALWFSRGDQFLSDPLECRQSRPGEIPRESSADRKMREEYKIVSNREATMQTYEVRRLYAFISCWNRSRGETAAMWREYVEKPAMQSGRRPEDGVVIASNPKSLIQALPPNISYGGVTYHPKNAARSDLGTLAFFYKPDSFKNEREFRMLYVAPHTETFDLQKIGQHFSINLQSTMHRVITHPRATPAFKERIESLLRKYVPDIQREDSALS